VSEDKKTEQWMLIFCFSHLKNFLLVLK
jgi:hypothetical protein